MTPEELKNRKRVKAAPNGIAGEFVRNPQRGNKWQHVNAIYYDGYSNGCATYSDQEILQSLCE